MKGIFGNKKAILTKLSIQAILTCLIFRKRHLAKINHLPFSFAANHSSRRQDLIGTRFMFHLVDALLDFYTRMYFGV